MHVLIFGGGGFLGRRLAISLLTDQDALPHTLSRLTLFDKEVDPGAFTDTRVHIFKGDISKEEQVEEVLSAKPDIIFHLAAVVSGEAEKNLDLGMNVNVHATLHILERCRRLRYCPLFIFASSCAVFGGDVSLAVTDFTAPLPRSSYGCQKAIAELLINDYSRRGFIDGRSLRLPTIAIRPGKANAATSSFISAIIREPLSKQHTNCPVSPETQFWIQAPSTVINNFIHAISLTSKELGDNRIITLPGLTTSVQDLVDTLAAIGGSDSRSFITWDPDPFLQSIVLTWPPNFSIERAEKLGFTKDSTAAEIVKAYIVEEGIQV